MKKSLVVIGFVLMSSMLHAEVIEESHDLTPLVGVHTWDLVKKIK